MHKIPHFASPLEHQPLLGVQREQVSLPRHERRLDPVAAIVTPRVVRGPPSLPSICSQSDPINRIPLYGFDLPDTKHVELLRLVDAQHGARDLVFLLHATSKQRTPEIKYLVLSHEADEVGHVSLLLQRLAAREERVEAISQGVLDSEQPQARCEGDAGEFECMCELSPCVECLLDPPPATVLSTRLRVSEQSSTEEHENKMNKQRKYKH